MAKKCLVFFSSLLILFFLAGEPANAAAGKIIIINKAVNQLGYFENGSLRKVFKVGTGRSQSLTPEGKFKVVNKIVNRPYYSKGIPGGDPRNPLGNRWLGLNARGTWGTTYAIHGNSNPASIGGYVSSGCVRMYDHEVEWLYNQVPINTPVVITTSGKSFSSLGKMYGALSGGESPGSAYPLLKKGSRGAAVSDLQRKLTGIGYRTNGIDGIFGSNTERAVLSFQKARGLTVDGIAGPQVWGALKSSPPAQTKPSNDSALKKSGNLKRGSRGAAVSELQQRLTAKGFSTKGVDGIFGPATEAAVKKFQSARGLAVDGIAGPATKGALLK
ncbi:L,D-transpeptidase family protein [Metabacillus sp. 84]|uniref:L,D-transpeptidase family protein n=1 Tax=Metabacillus sp. 84 TaxID=3404705 RepID=UPI003CF217CE